ncbi:MAG TPA: hypothetical protein VJ938_00030 [Acidimicrobiia bacterium]|nr:hypothetical protein [Acidimicrobiia bacterium]
MVVAGALVVVVATGLAQAAATRAMTTRHARTGRAPDHRDGPLPDLKFKLGIGATIGRRPPEG